jgi:hypothetical protein
MFWRFNYLGTRQVVASLLLSFDRILLTGAECTWRYFGAFSLGNIGSAAADRAVGVAVARIPEQGVLIK